MSWYGDHSAESLLRDQLTRNHASGILWQGDPDCVLLRERFHHLSDAQEESLATFAGLSGGVLMTSDKLDELPEAPAALFASLLRETDLRCSFPKLAAADEGLIVQQAERGDGSTMLNLFNARDMEIEVAPEMLAGLLPDAQPVRIAPHASRIVRKR